MLTRGILLSPIGISGKGGILGGVDAIPDSGDLQAWYDWSLASGTSTVEDQTDNNNDLTGTYSGPTTTINGVQAGLFDGSDDEVTVSFSNQSQPNHIFIVLQVESVPPDTDNENFFDGASENVQTLFIDEGANNGEYQMFAGSRIGGNTVAQVGDIVVASCLFNEGSSVLRLNGAQDATGSVGSGVLDGFTVGNYAGTANDQYANFRVGEMFHYPMDKSSVVSDVEQYLTDKWGPVGFA